MTRFSAAKKNRIHCEAMLHHILHVKNDISLYLFITTHPDVVLNFQEKVYVIHIQYSTVNNRSMIS